MKTASNVSVLNQTIGWTNTDFCNIFHGNPSKSSWCYSENHKVYRKNKWDHKVVVILYIYIYYICTANNEIFNFQVVDRHYNASRKKPERNTCTAHVCAQPYGEHYRPLFIWLNTAVHEWDLTTVRQRFTPIYPDRQQSFSTQVCSAYKTSSTKHIQLFPTLVSSATV